MNTRNYKVYLFIYLAMLLCALPLSAASRTCKSGVYINQIKSIDIKTGMAVVDFWYWAVTDGAAVSVENLELINGDLEPLGKPITQKRGQKHYISARYLAHVVINLNTHKFPFDRQTLILSFEDSECTMDQMTFVPDTVNSGIDQNFKLNDWEIGEITYTTGIHHYATSFGYLDIPSGQGSNYSQFSVKIELIRRGNFWQKIFKYFWAVIVSVIVGLFALLIRVCDLDARFGMAVGALFANVGCSFLLSDMLPPSPDVSLAELISYISLGLIMLFLVESIISLILYNHSHVKLSQRLDLSVFVFGLISYSTIWFFII